MKLLAAQRAKAGGLWRRARECRGVIVGGAAVVGVLGLAGGAVGVVRFVMAPPASAEFASHPAGSGQRVRGAGTVIIHPDQRVEFCTAPLRKPTATDPGVPSCLGHPRPDGLVGIALTGVYANDLLDPQSNDGFTWDLVTVTGTLTGDRVDVDSIGPPPPPVPPSDEPQQYPPEQLDAIWAVQLAPEVEDVRSYAIEHADEFAGRWWDEDNPTILVVAFSDGLDKHRAEIDRLWPHSFRVIKAPHTEQALTETQERLNSDDELRHKLPGGLLIADVDVRSSVVQVDVAVADDATRNAIGERYGLRMLSLQPKFDLLDGEQDR